MINVPISPGELLDKISILRIKQGRLTDPVKLENVAHELKLLEEVERAELTGKADYASLFEQLLAVNAKLWDIEEGKRDCERRRSFGDDFIALARAVYLENDHRARLKRGAQRGFWLEDRRGKRATPHTEVKRYLSNPDVVESPTSGYPKIAFTMQR